jgi:hypothetical protein
VADPVNDWLARFQAAQPADHALRLTNLEAQLTTLTVALAASIQKIATMEEHMSQTDDAVAELNTPPTTWPRASTRSWRTRPASTPTPPVSCARSATGSRASPPTRPTPSRRTAATPRSTRLSDRSGGRSG